MKQKILLLISVMLVAFMMCSCTQKEPGSSFRDDSSLQQDKNIAYKQYMENKPTVNFFYADAEALSNTVYEEYIVDESEYTVKIAFSTDKQIKDVNITSLTYEEHGFVVDSVLYTIDKIDSNTAFVIGVVFYGDMTTYGVSFTDLNNETHYYSLSQSGFDGSLVANEYIPK